MSNLSVSQRAAAQGCPYHRMLLNRAAQQSETVADSVPLDRVVGTVREHFENPVKALEELHKDLGQSFQTLTPNGPVRFDYHPDTTRKILTGSEGDEPLFKKSAQQTHGLARALGEENLLLASGDDWQSSREALADFFSATSMRTEKRAGFVGSILDHHFNKVESELSGGQGEVELSGMLRKATLDVALNTLFSAKSSDQELETLTHAFEVVNQRVGREWLLPASVTGLSEPKKEFQNAAAVIDGWAQSLVEKRGKLAEQPDDALTALMSAQDPETGQTYSRERLVSEVKNLMLAGHETTANLITWTLAELARNPIKQNELRNQVLEVSGERAPTMAQIKKLSPIFQLWRQEATEHPPNFLLAREAIQDTTIGPEESPIEVKAGTTVLVSTQHANAEAGTMFSFGGGRRFCLGINLARLETEYSVARLLQKFEISDTGAKGVHSGLTQTPEDTTVSLRARGVLAGANQE